MTSSRPGLLTVGLLIGLSSPARGASPVTEAKIPDGCKLLKDCQVKRELRPKPGRSRNHEFSVDNKGVYYWGTKYDFDPKSFRIFKTKDCEHHTDGYVGDAKDIYFAQAQSGGQSCNSGDCHGYYWSPLQVKDPASFKLLDGAYAISGGEVLYIWSEGMTDKADAETFQVLLCGGKDGAVVGMDKSRFYIDGKAALRNKVQALVEAAQKNSEPTQAVRPSNRSTKKGPALKSKALLP